MARIPIDDDDNTRQQADAPGATPGDAADLEERVTAEGADPVESAGTPAAADADVQRLQAERDDFYNRLARATADFKNTQRRLENEFDQRVQYANQSLIKSLLPVIDNFERALAVDPAKADAKSILKGLQLVHDQWISVLKQQNVNEIAPAPGTPFDPTQHEALMQQDAPQYKTTTVTQLLQKGYALQGRPIRPAQVAVSRAQ